MKKKGHFLRFREFWVQPFLIGSLIGSGYGITQKLLIGNSNPNKNIISSDTNQLLENKKSSFPSEYLNLKKTIGKDLIKTTTSKKEPELNLIISFPQVEKSKLFKNHIHKKDKSLIKKPSKETRKKMNLQPSQTKENIDHENTLSRDSFFQRNHIEELFKTLPNE